MITIKKTNGQNHHKEDKKRKAKMKFKDSIPRRKNKMKTPKMRGIFLENSRTLKKNQNQKLSTLIRSNPKTPKLDIKKNPPNCPKFFLKIKLKTH